MTTHVMGIRFSAHSEQWTSINAPPSNQGHLLALAGDGRWWADNSCIRRPLLVPCGADLVLPGPYRASGLEPLQLGAVLGQVGKRCPQSPAGILQHEHRQRAVGWTGRVEAALCPG